MALETLSHSVATEASHCPISRATFELFPKLPPELRLKVWSYANREAILEPRIMELDLHTDIWQSSTPCSKAFPATLHTCRESRMEGQRIYHRLEFLEQIIWINFSVDILYLQIRPRTGFEESLFQLMEADRLKLRYLALWTQTWYSLCVTGSRSMVVKALPNLHELILVDEDDGLSLAEMKWKWGSEMTFVQLSAEEKRWITPMPNYEGYNHLGRPMVDKCPPSKPVIKYRHVKRDPKAPWTRTGSQDWEGNVIFSAGTRQGMKGVVYRIRC